MVHRIVGVGGVGVLGSFSCWCVGTCPASGFCFTTFSISSVWRRDCAPMRSTWIHDSEQEGA
jgi:hypothetical protein